MTVAPCRCSFKTDRHAGSPTRDWRTKPASAAITRTAAGNTPANQAHPPRPNLRVGPIRAASQGASELWHVGPHYPKFPVYPQGWGRVGSVRRCLRPVCLRASFFIPRSLPLPASLCLSLLAAFFPLLAGMYSSGERICDCLVSLACPARYLPSFSAILREAAHVSVALNN